MAIFSPTSGVNPGTRLKSDSDTIIRQVVSNADGSDISPTDVSLLATAAKQDVQIAAEQAIIPGSTAVAVTASDSTPLTSRALWVGGAGDLSVRLSGAPSTTVVFLAVPAGSLIPISVVRVMAATTATGIVTIS